jgi:hypothetical protein
LAQAEFEKLLTHFTMAYHAYMYDQHVAKKASRRSYSAGQEPYLTVIEKADRPVDHYAAFHTSGVHRAVVAIGGPETTDGFHQHLHRHRGAGQRVHMTVHYAETTM